MVRPWPPAFALLAMLAAALPAGGSTQAARDAVAASSATTADAPPDAPTALRVVARRDLTVTLAWDAALTGPAVSGYVVEGGVLPGQVLGSIPTGSAATVFTFDAPPGQFLVRVHAIGSGGRSDASNEIPLVVGHVVTLAAPSAPASLLGLAAGDTLTLSWTPTHSGGIPTGLWLSVSGALDAVLPLPLGDSFSFTGVPPGAYTFALTAVNAAGASAPSNAVTLIFPDTCSGPPEPPEDFRSWQADGMTSIAWSPPRNGPAVSYYSVHVTGDLALSFDTTDRLVSAPLPPGQYAVRVEAHNACGRSADAAAAPVWTAAIRQGPAQIVHWPMAPGVEDYRVFFSTSAADLDPLGPGVAFFDARISPVAAPIADPDETLYYRVFRAAGPIVTGGGRITSVPAFDIADHLDWPGNVTPALWDVDGDGCLDMVGAWGRCDGTFETYSLAPMGLAGFDADGPRKDSRFADFTGDGLTDIFTNVYAPADQGWFRSVLHVGQPQGGFVEDSAMTALGVTGRGETILAADFDNDGDLDIFNPTYTHLDDGGHNWLLVNDGAGHFTDISATAGVALNAHAPPEAAQALDFDGDGWLDIHVGSQLFLNNGDLTFTDIAAGLRLPNRFDEGMRLFDADLDGDLDLVHHDTNVTRFYRNDGGLFDAGTMVDGSVEGDTAGFGLNVCDINGDGFEDVVVASNDRTTSTGVPHLLVNAGGSLVRSDFEGGTAVANDLLACADLDGSGTPDIVSRWTVAGTSPLGNPVRLVQMRTLRTRAASTATITLRIVDASGRRNQQGRPVRLRPVNGPDVTLLRMVESGSGYLAQNGYDLLVATPWPGDYEVEVRFAHGWVQTTARPGDALTIRADGTVTAGLE